MTSISVPILDCTAPTQRPALTNYGTVVTRSESTDTVRTICDSDLGDDDKSPLLPRKVRRVPRRFVAGVRRAAPSFRRLNPSMTLVNSGSVARDHLASERTFLAYVRTSLGIASMGVGASPPPFPARAPREKLTRPPLRPPFSPRAAAEDGAVSTGDGGHQALLAAARRHAGDDRPRDAHARVRALFPFSVPLSRRGLMRLRPGRFVRYFTIQQALLKGKFPVARVAVVFLALVLAADVVVIFAILVGVRSVTR